MLADSEKQLRIIGTQIYNYYFICKTKLWLFSHHIQMEQESVSLGKIPHKDSYKRDKKDRTIDNLISFDFVRKGETWKFMRLRRVKR